MPMYINPGVGEKRVADLSGHVVIIGTEEPVMIMDHMEPEARKLGCVSVAEKETLQAQLEDRIKEKMEAEFKAKYGITGDGGEDEPGKTVQDKELDQEQRKAVMDAMNQMLDSKDDSLFTADNKPRAAELDKITGFDVPKEIREELWALVLADIAGE